MATTTKTTTGTSGQSDASSWRIPLIGHLSTPMQFKIIGGLMGLMMVGSVISGIAYVRGARVNAVQVKTSSQMLTDSQRIAKSAALAVRGDVASFKVLKESSKTFDGMLKSLKDGGEVSGVSIQSASGDAEALLNSLASSWKSETVEIDRLVSSQMVLADFGKALSDLGTLDEALLNSSRDLQSAIDGSSSSTNRQIKLSQALPFLTQRMGKSTNALAATQDVNLSAAFLLGKDLNTFKSYTQALIKGDQVLGVTASDDEVVKEKLKATEAVFQKFADQVGIIQRNQADLIKAKSSFVKASSMSEGLATATEALLKHFEKQDDKNRLVLFFGIGFFVLFLTAIGFLFKIFSDEGNASVRAADVERENQVQQQAIMTLLDEIGELADGNLTIKATVNDTFTGAIADSINFTVVELRRVIQNVVEATKRVGESASTSSSISSQLAESAREQFDRLAKTGESIVKMSMNMDDIAQETAEAAKASRQSLDVSQGGLRIVEQTIERMNTIRDTIQETSKKIKLLGESSTAIGEVTGLIRDITKQINILALNAAIQAASAGEAGRGFAVVAGEVQRLALSSAEAAKRIDDLVLTIQEDAKGAVSAMELSTREVVEGAKLTDKAGSALKEIEGSVSGLTRAIEEVTSKVEAESENASNLSLDMRLLQEYTEKTVDESKRGDESVQQVRGVADELRESVANFKV